MKKQKKAKKVSRAPKAKVAKAYKKVRVVKKAGKKVEGNWCSGNRYSAEMVGKGAVYTALKILADGKKRTDVVKLDAKKVSALKKALKKKDSKEFDKLVIELVTKPCLLDSAAKKQGLTKNTAYCPVNADMREILA